MECGGRGSKSGGYPFMSWTCQSCRGTGRKAFYKPLTTSVNATCVFYYGG